jgi:diadenosine tetraphosphatase ApaH/serine/threonine PP2A family protein phosphatase
MKIAILADIRANETALLAVLEHLRHVGVDHIWIIGSLLSAGPDPIAVIDIIRRIAPKNQCLIGHLDGAILSGSEESMWGFGASARTTCRWTHDQLKPQSESGIADIAAHDRWSWLSSLVFEGGDDACRFYSGTPRHPDTGYLPISGHYHYGDSLPAECEAVSNCAFVGSIGQPGIVFADTMEWTPICTNSLSISVEGRRFIACPGAVGQPRDQNPKAGYAIYDGKSIVWHRVAYDVAEAQRRILANPKLPKFYAERLEVGR